MDLSYVISDMLSEKDIQTAQFVDKVQERNKKEAVLIAAKYDLKHSFVTIITNYEGKGDNYLYEMVKAFEIMLKERKEFLDLFSSYL